jgi:hypothetical protein
MATLGIDCDVVLYHPDIDAGAPFGLLLERKRAFSTNIDVIRQAFKQADGSIQDEQVVAFTVVLGDNLPNPDGSVHVGTKSGDYAKLLDFANKRQGIAVQTPNGIIAGLFAIGNYFIEEHYQNIMTISIQLSSNSNIFPPANKDRYEQSRWQENTYTGSMTWDNSYWRV